MNASSEPTIIVIYQCFMGRFANRFAKQRLARHQPNDSILSLHGQANLRCFTRVEFGMVTLDMMIMHAQAVRRGIERALMVVDMPFGSYEEGPEQAFRNAADAPLDRAAWRLPLWQGAASAPTWRLAIPLGSPAATWV